MVEPVKLGDGSSEDIGLDAWDLAAGPSGAAVLAWNDADGEGSESLTADRRRCLVEPKLLSDAYCNADTDRDRRQRRPRHGGLPVWQQTALDILEGSQRGGAGRFSCRRPEGAGASTSRLAAAGSRSWRGRAPTTGS